MRLYLIRHAEPNYEQDCLTPAGRLEAAALGEYLAGLGIDRLFSSPLGRARETASYVAESTGCDLTILDWTRELPYHPVIDENGFSYMDLHGHLVREDRYQANPADWQAIPAMQDVPLEDLLAPVIAGSDAFLASLGYVRQNGAYAMPQSNQRKVAVVCHQGLGLLWLSHLLAIPAPLMWAGFFLHTSSITTILFDERQPGYASPRCIGMGEIPHLRCNQITPSTMGIKANYW